MNTLFKSTIYLAILIGLFGCATNENSILQQQQQDDQIISDFLKRNNISATKSSTGLYYVLDKVGTGDQASTVSQIASIDVDVYLLGGAKFITEKDIVYRFSNGLLMQGVVEATTLLKEGGNGRFYIPSALGFGQGSGTVNGINIPANATIYAEVKLNDIRTDQEQQVIEEGLIKKYLADNKLTSTKDSLGVYYVRTTQGSGALPRTGNRLAVTYKGTLLNKQVFDSGDFTFTLGAGASIRGFEIATRFMQKGEKGIALIPSHLAYADKGSGDKIRPFATLVFELEIIGFE
ncbi:MAG: hypothetical protein EAZ08_00625 [Cytophagales bacterium]|nr:MAG: hypothetical protein EAZ08_00625 [Cytophagales bacterium]